MPIVEPEVTLGPGTYTIEDNALWSERIYSHVFRLLNEYNVILDAILLKPNSEPHLPPRGGGGQGRGASGLFALVPAGA